MKKILFVPATLLMLAAACNNDRSTGSTEIENTTTPVDHTAAADTVVRQPEDTNRNRQQEVGASLRQGQPVDTKK